ncbi:MAG: universal stress protein [Candidatus Dormibacteria bacterium]
MFTKIVTGTDGSDTAAAAVDCAIDLATSGRSELHLVSVAREPTATLMPGDPTVIAEAYAEEGWRQAAGQELQAILDSAAAKATARGLTPVLHVLFGEPADAIMDLAESLGADAIVVGNGGMTGARRFLGSVPNKISHHAPCTVVIVKTT